MELTDMYKMAHDYVVPISITIELLNKCNECCEHCYIPSHTNDGLSTDEVVDVLKQFRKMGGLNVTFTGGEIFLRKDLLYIIETARKLKMRVFLLTNATLIDDEMARKLKEQNIAEISVSIYSMDEIIHDEITKIKGALVKTLRGIECAKNNNIPVMVKTPLMKKNKYAYREVSVFCEKNGFNFMTSPIIFSKSDGNASPHQLEIDDSDLREVMKEIAVYKKDEFKMNFEEACGTLKYAFSIDCHGNVFPCNAFYYNLGNIKQKGLVEIWKSPKMHAVQNIMKKDLQICSKCEMAKECNRCPGLADLEDGDMRACSSTARRLAVVQHKILKEEKCDEDI